MANKKFTAEEVINAIRGTGGIKAKIAQKLGCHRHTVDNYLAEYVTAKRAYDDECELPLDIAESVVLLNIQYAAKLQELTKAPVDSTDSKWYLSKKGKGRGYVERTEHTGPEGDDILIRVRYDDADAEST